MQITVQFLLNIQMFGFCETVVLLILTKSFAGELVKFGMFPKSEALHCLKVINGA
jgi:hypothetical protein